jgi:hypothetical protein
MKEHFLEELNNIEDLEQRKLLKNIIIGCFSGLIDYQETVNRELAERVFNEVEDTESHYQIYMTVCQQQEVDPIDEFLFPVFDEDLEEVQYNMGEIIAKLAQNEEIELFTIFMKCEYPKVKRLVDSSQIYRGTLRTNLNEYEIKVRLKPNQRYIQEIERLYHLFHKNGICWKTINYGYANRFFNVCLIACDGELNSKEEIKEITFDLAEYEAYKMTRMVLLWNIERVSARSNGFPVAAIDRVNYKHVISIAKLGEDNGYLVDEETDHFRYLSRNQSEIAVICPEERSTNWNLLKVTRPSPNQERVYTFPLISNSRGSSFINNYAQKYSAAIRTKAEILRILGAFDISNHYELKAIELNAYPEVEYFTYDMNFFIHDDIRLANDKKIMTLKFKALTDSFLCYDMLSFLVSEVQMSFPEYECRGVLL